MWCWSSQRNDCCVGYNLRVGSALGGGQGDRVYFVRITTFLGIRTNWAVLTSNLPDCSGGTSWRPLKEAKHSTAWPEWFADRDILWNECTVPMSRGSWKSCELLRIRTTRICPTVLYQHSLSLPQYKISSLSVIPLGNSFLYVKIEQV